MPPRLTRRDFLKLSLAAAGEVLLSGWGYARLIEPRWVEFTFRDLPIRHLPPHLAGATLVQISDMHIGVRYDWRYQVAALKKAVGLSPDFVVYTGDFITYEDSRQFEQLDEVLAYAPHGKHGTAAVLGNHDYGFGWKMPEVARSVAGVLRNHGIRLLRNERLSFAGLEIIGLDDFWGTNYHPEEVLRAAPAEAASLVLCHNPDVADEPVWGNYQGWILAGHTHGGQVRPPFLPPPVLPLRNPRYTAGAFDLEGGRRMYINRALGNLWPVRFNVRPEVAVFRLSPL